MLNLQMTQLEKISEAKNVWRRLGKRLIAGGYVRDLLFGGDRVLPKDIDVWVQRRGRSVDDLTVIARDVFHRAKQEIGVVHNAGNQYGNGNIVFTSAGASDIEPIELIFHDHGDHRDLMDYFDIDICKCYIGASGLPVATTNAVVSQRNKHLILRNQGDMTRYLDHVKRVIAKYPDMKPLVWGLHNPWMQGVYQRAIAEGVINAPREILQAEGQGDYRDEVRLEVGADLARAAIFNAATAEVEVPRGQNQVYRVQNVPNGFLGYAVQWVGGVR